MYTKTLIAIVFCMILCIKLGQGLQCYEHDFCLGNDCDTITMRNVTCKSNETKCWKLKVPKGVKRGCGEDKCHVEIDISVFETANKCCSTDFCNTSNQMTLPTITIFTIGFISILHRFYVQ